MSKFDEILALFLIAFFAVAGFFLLVAIAVGIGKVLA
jgi:hypothetical protein